MCHSIFKVLRPHQWVKNLFIFLPIFFGKHLLEVEYWLPSLLAFVSFSLAASGVYCFNDINDVEADRLHPVKRHRPIASGALSMSWGYALMSICFILSIGVLWVGAIITIAMDLIGVSLVIVGYIGMNILYSIKLKQIAIVDILIISLGFVLRLLMGSLATGIVLSKWLVLMTMLLALFLALAKRWDDVWIYETTGMKARGNIDKYNTTFMNQALSIVAAITVVCYIMYTISDEVVARIGSSHLYLTAIFVLAGLLRHLQLTLVENRSGSPTKVLLQDRFMQICVIGWAITFGIILYC